MTLVELAQRIQYLKNNAQSIIDRVSPSIPPIDHSLEGYGMWSSVAFKAFWAQPEVKVLGDLSVKATHEFLYQPFLFTFRTADGSAWL